MSWSRGDAAASRHDGRTGGAIGGGGPSPAVSRAALFELFQQTRGAILDSARQDIVALPPELSSRRPSGWSAIAAAAGPDVGVSGGGSGSGDGGGGGGRSDYEAAKAAATNYAARREAMLRGAAADGSPLALWRA